MSRLFTITRESSCRVARKMWCPEGQGSPHTYPPQGFRLFLPYVGLMLACWLAGEKSARELCSNACHRGFTQCTPDLLSVQLMQLNVIVSSQDKAGPDRQDPRPLVPPLGFREEGACIIETRGFATRGSPFSILRNMNSVYINMTPPNKLQ